MAMNRRGEPRIKKRISCELSFGEQIFNGLVLDVSSHGLFVQTAAKPSPGQGVHVVISAPTRPEPLAVHAIVARAKLVPPQLRTVAQGGVGLHIKDPPADFSQFVEDVRRPVKIQKVSILPGDQKGEADSKRLTKERLDRFFGQKAGSKKASKKPDESSASRGPGPYTRLPRWRVQLRHSGGDGSRSFIVRCENEDEAREQVLAELDEDWKIEGVQRI